MTPQSMSTAQLFATVIAAAGLFFTGCQIRFSAKATRANLWLELRKMFAEHDEIHRKFRPGGEWARVGNSGPTTADDWARVESYMGLFEHCEIMLQDKLIDQSTFEKIYAYRLKNLVNNSMVREKKLKDEAGSWTDFNHLMKRFQVSL